MAITNHERVGRALALLQAGLRPFVERELKAVYKQAWTTQVSAILGGTLLANPKGDLLEDVAAVFLVMERGWSDVFGRTLGRADRTLLFELRDVRNQWAHQKNFSTDDAYRVLDSAGRLLSSVSAPQADEIEKLKGELLRLRFDEQVRSEKRRTAGAAIESSGATPLKPWREVVTPHKDVASGLYQQAEFAADLWQVHLGEGSAEYLDPVEFFRRTYLTESLKRLLADAVRRLSGVGGDPVVQLQTNFGGGKTHSMLALHHLFSGTPPSKLAGLDVVLEAAGATELPAVKRVVLVGNKISPGNPVTKPDGTVVRTLWGELAYQIGGKKAFARIAADDAKSTSPGDALRELFTEYGPCLILIDEWVAYARQLHDESDLPGGSFETQFSFAQVLTESAKLAPACLLVVSLPASDSATSPHALADDLEVGGIRGRNALQRLHNVVGRLESSWRPASAEEGFEIVRRRLFEPMHDPAQFKDRDVVARAFADLYRTQHAEFPPECRDAEYEKRIKAAYPIHPEIFDRLYEDWSTLAKFQRTRGVLRLMAAVIHSLWEKGDRNPLILPAHISIDDPRVQSELTSRYLSDNWVPVIERDVDGPSSLPLRIDAEQPNLARFSACRRVARTIYMGSAPITAAAHRGIEDRRVKLGCVMPGEPPSVFGDALRRLATAATYLYQDGPRYWYSTQPTVTKLAEDRAEQLKRDPDKVVHEIEQRLRANLREKGEFNRIHPCPTGGQDVPDDLDARLVVLGTEAAYTREPGNAGETAALAILESRGSAPRIYRNTLVFLAPDKARLQDLDEAVRKLLAWRQILAEKNELNLDPHQVRQAETQAEAAESVVTGRLPETYQWLLVPGQQEQRPDAAIRLEASRLSGPDALAVRASKKLRSEEKLLASMGGAFLRIELDRVPLWRGDHVSVKQLADDFARYPYLPRLKDPAVLVGAVRDGVALTTWQQDTFAFAESFDEAAGRYRGLRAAAGIQLPDAESPGLLVKAAVAQAQFAADAAATPVAPGGTGTTAGPADSPAPIDPTSPDAPRMQPKRYHGTVELDASRVGRDAGRIADEVIAHLVGLVGANVSVTLEIEAEIPNGAPDNVVRTVTENGRTLKFKSQGFERE
jgi:predicted AAA+ superfamily ATPase